MKAFTLIELLVVASVGAMLTLLSIPLFSSVIFTEDLDTQASLMLSSIRTAQSRTVNGKNGEVYGVYFDSSTNPDRYIIFQGNVYSPTDPNNEIYNISSRISISGVSLNGGGNSLLFEEFDGETGNFGTVTVSNSNGESRIISITSLGVTDVSEN